MMTYTYAIMEVSQRAYDEVRSKLERWGYADQIDSAGNLDMHGIALTCAGRASSHPKIMLDKQDEI
jgi:hypothetical protein